MRAHVLKDGVVVNTIAVGSLDFIPGLVDASKGGRIGDRWDGKKYIPPAKTPEPETPVITKESLLAELELLREKIEKSL